MATVGVDFEDKYTYAPPFSKLEDMAALAAAMNVWNYYFSHHDWEYCENELKKVNEIINDMKVPNYIRKKITALCETMENQMSSYDTDMMRMCHARRNRYHFFLHGIVWDINGHINDKKTAEKVLQCPERSNDNDKVFEVMAKYCLETHIKDIPMSSLSEKLITLFGGYKGYELTEYWIAWKRREENASGEYDDRFQTLKRRIFHQMKYASFLKWPMCAYEYFWDFLDENEQVLMTRCLIQNDKKYQMFLFSKMSRNQLRRLYLAVPAYIIKNYFRLGDLELAIATWKHARLTIHEGQFKLLMHAILDSEMYLEDNKKQCLIDLWNSAPDNLINYVIDAKNGAITDYFFLETPKSPVSCSSFDFLKAVLLRTTLEFRKQFFLEKGLHLLLNYPHVLFRSFIEDCLDASDQLEMTETLLVTAMESEPTRILRCFRDVLYCSVEEFDAFLKFLTLDPDLQMRVRKRLLRSGVLIGKLIKIDNWVKLCQFIDELYPKDEKEARRQKKKASNSCLRSHFHYWSCFRRNGDDKFTEIDNLLAQFFTPEEMATFKENIMEQFQTACSDTGWNSDDIVVKRVDIPKLTAWCYHDNEERISQFKRSFPIDTAFQLFLREAVERYVNRRDADLSFSSLEHLLWWKFASKKCIKSFKKSQIRCVMRARDVRTYNFCKEWIRRVYLSNVLKKIIAWVFDGNEFQIEKFERLYQEDDKLKIIYWLKVKEDCLRCDIEYYHSSDESD
ncbi:uncharacterized protein LOC135846254 [Planococcus citri]|uniref:uncharacterized protein LOC135846254 n=1 Tax=Planococcus citri TaxID=170843 RepID=UPI0031F752AC